MKLFKKQWTNTTIANVPATWIKEVGGLGVPARLPNAKMPRLPYFSQNVFWVQVFSSLPEHKKHARFDSVCVWHNKLVFLFATHGVLVPQLINFWLQSQQTLFSMIVVLKIILLIHTFDLQAMDHTHSIRQTGQVYHDYPFVICAIASFLLNS